MKTKPVVSDLIIVDYRCFCKDCESRIKEIYYLPGSCSNCGKKWIAKIRKGDIHGWHDCPHCGVSGLRAHHSYGTMDEAEEMMTTVKK